MVILQIIKPDKDVYFRKFDNYKKLVSYFDAYVKQEPIGTFIGMELEDRFFENEQFGRICFSKIGRKEYRPVCDENGRIKTIKTEDGDVIAIAEVYICD